MTENIQNHSSHLSRLFNNEELDLAVFNLLRVIKENKEVLKDCYIAVRGISGIGIGSIIHYFTKMPLIIVRREGELMKTVGGAYQVEGMPLYKSFDYVILDDFIANGYTASGIISAINKGVKSEQLIRCNNHTANFKGTLLYKQRHFDGPFEKFVDVELLRNDYNLIHMQLPPQPSD